MIDNKVELIPTDPSNPYPLGRAGVSHDERNAQFRALVAPPARASKPGQSWYTRDVYNQGQSPQCAAEAAVGVLRTAPFRTNFTEHTMFDDTEERRQLYKRAQAVDPWQGDAYEGTSTDAPMKVLRAEGVITSYRWLFGEADLWEWVQWFGPAVVGTIWTRDMFTPDPNGYLNPTGPDAGGHAWRVVQAHAQRQAYRMVNSWGRGWSESGRAWVRRADMAALLARDGEAVTIG